VNGSDPALIEFRGVDVAFGHHLVLGKLSLEVRRSEIVCVVGPSGCGKTTALRVASGLIRPARGEVIFAGAPIKGPRRDVAVVFQDYSKALLPWRTAAGNVALALEATGTPRAERPDRIASCSRTWALPPSRKSTLRRCPVECSSGCRSPAVSLKSRRR
jgi:NitT/TauT family transport system ATP-binding protein